MAESLHRLSGGRLILGLGGGGSDQEFEAFGLGTRSPRDKVDGLEEAIRILRGLWTDEAFSFEGRLFSVREAHLEPKPDTPIPIWTGSYGRRSLEVTGRLADGWNPSIVYVPPEEAAKRRDVVRRAAADAGRDADAVTCSYNVSVYVDEKGESNPRIVAGPPGQVADRLAEFVRLGFTTLIFWARGGPEGRERLAREVLPLVREAVAAD
jgi:alkanesulfonate monooxygenase SsuD/methylene tetrahydromethanopterin reductase-like flavin-dependent oxidoreductase (luciferase family)